MSDVLRDVNPEPEQPGRSLTTIPRDDITRTRHASGISQAELARLFEISYQRVHQILRGE